MDRAGGSYSATRRIDPVGRPAAIEQHTGRWIDPVGRPAAMERRAGWWIDPVGRPAAIEIAAWYAKRVETR